MSEGKVIRTKTTAGHVCSNQDGRSTGLEFAEYPIALTPVNTFSIVQLATGQGTDCSLSP